MAIDWYLDRMRSYADREAVSDSRSATSYTGLYRLVESWKRRLSGAGVRRGSIVSMLGDYSADSAACLLALSSLQSIAVPLAWAKEAIRDECERVSKAHFRVVTGDEGAIRILTGQDVPRHQLVKQLIERSESGLIVFSSGSTGEPKAALHSIERLIEKYRRAGRPARILVFLLLDHLGGINTLLHTLGAGGTVVVPESRDPRTVCVTIESQRVEVLPTSPTFLNMMLLSGEIENHDVSSLRLITYGTEPMPPTTLKRLQEHLPSVELQQTYGLTEVGVMRSRSRSSGSLWMQVGGIAGEFETKVVGGILHVRAKSAMLGYLNAPSPFDENGWMNTGDRVEEDGDWIRILGRDSEIINVGGRKVIPVEVEGVIRTIDGVEEVAVYGEKNALTGHIVCARVRLAPGYDRDKAKAEIRCTCRARFEPFMVPQRIVFVDELLHNQRFKTMRR